MTRLGFWKIILISLSLSCLFFLKGFRYLIYPTGDRYFEYEIPHYEFAGIFVCVVVVGSLFAGILYLVERVQRSRVRTELQILFVMAGIFSFFSMNGEIRRVLFPASEAGLNIELPAAVLLLITSFAFWPKFSFAGVFKNLCIIALILSPLAIVLCFQTLYIWLMIDANELSPQSIESKFVVSTKPPLKHRVVWIIFDELESATMLHRPVDVKMPAMEEFLAESVVGDNSFSPHEFTSYSIPSLLTGRIISSADPVAPDDMAIVFQDGGEPESLRKSANIFTDVLSLGGNAAAVGWFHPYPRVFKDSLSFSYWRPVQKSSCASIAECTSQFTADALDEMPVQNPLAFRKKVHFGDGDPDRGVANQVERVSFLLQKAKEVIVRSEINLSFLHFSIPHAPFIAEPNQTPIRGYYSSLKVVDMMIAELRRTLEAANLWDQTTVIISADHWWRFKRESDFKSFPEAERRAINADIRIPFAVKVAGQKTGFHYTHQLNTVITREMVRNLLSGNLTTEEDVVAWLDRMARDYPNVMEHIPQNLPFNESVTQRVRGEAP